MSAKPLIPNELLAFINHAIDYMDEVSILQICTSNFKEEEICSGKRLLFQALGKLDQMPSRRRDGGEKSVQDIITILKNTDPDDVPVFVAKELHKLPPVTFDHVDVTRLLKDITTLKASLVEVQSKMEASNNTIGELRAEVELLRNAVSTSRSPDASNVNKRRGAQNASICSFESASCTTSPVAENACPAKCSIADAVSTPVRTTTHVRTSTPRAYAAIVASHKPAMTQTKRQAGNEIGSKRSCASDHNDVKQLGPNKGSCDKDGYIKVEKKKTKKPPCRNLCGTALAGPNMLLRPATPSTQLYVSRLHHSTTVEDVVQYIRTKTNWTLRVERLESRHSTNFKSFVVRVPTHHLANFLKEEFWPKGVMYRRFRGQLQDTTKRNTTPSFRVN